jgi:hypothetical protein
MNNIFSTALLMLLILCGTHIHAQCPTGQISVEMEISTDLYGYEGYWEIVPAGNNCGVGTVASGGNSNVGCSGAGAQNQTPGGYGNNMTINVGPFCLTEGGSYDLIYVDDYADGGFEFEISVNGYIIKNFDAITGGHLTFTFEASEPFAYDMGVHSLSTPLVYDYAGSKSVSGTYFNYGSSTITALDVNYQIDNDPVQTMALSGLNIANFEAATFTHSLPWNATIGNYILKVWISNINGNADMNVTNDILQLSIEIGQGIPNIIDNYVNGYTNILEIANSSNSVTTPTDLDFHPILSKNQLWVTNKRTEAIGGSTVIIENVGESNQSSISKTDGNSWHFMSLPTGIAFSTNGNFATSTGVFDANHNGGQPFTGPALWSGDLSIYAEPSGGNGSHLDMLHVSPYSMGIASEKDNVFWVFDEYSNDIVRYDFVDDHGPGNSFHGDGIIHRYNDFSVAGDPNRKVVSHLVVDDQWVYVVDYGSQSVFRIELNTGSLGSTPTFGPFESVAEYKYVTGYNTEVLVDSGLVEPAGIDVIGDRMIVSDYSNGEIIIYDISVVPAMELGRLSTSAQGIMGIKIGPDGRIYYVDFDANTVNVVNLAPLGISENNLLVNVNVYPNPSKDHVTISLPNGGNDNYDVSIISASGIEVYHSNTQTESLNISTQNWASGIYNIKVSNRGDYFTENIIVQH